MPEQQSLMLHRTRRLFIRQRTAVINSIRTHLAEFGIVAPVGRNGVDELFDVVADTSDTSTPNLGTAAPFDLITFAFDSVGVGDARGLLKMRVMPIAATQLEI